MAISNVIRFDAIRTVLFGSLSTSYVNIGTPLSHIIRVFKMINTSDVDATISFDGGITDNDYIPAGGFCLYDFSANAGSDGQLSLQKGTQVAAKMASAPTVGGVVITTIYARGE